MDARATRLRFGNFELDPGSATLLRGGRRVRLQPQPLRVLTILVARAGTVVSREELRDAVWDRATFVEFDPDGHILFRESDDVNNYLSETNLDGSPRVRALSDPITHPRIDGVDCAVIGTCSRAATTIESSAEIPFATTLLEQSTGPMRARQRVTDRSQRWRSISSALRRPWHVRCRRTSESTR